MTPVLNAAPPPPPTAGHPVAGAVLALAGGLLWLIPAAVVVLIVPKFIEVFEKFDGDLPAMSVAVITVAKAVSTWWPLVALACLAVVVGLVALCATVRARWPVALAGTFAGLSLLGVVVTITLTAVALFLPLAETVETLGPP